MNGSEIYNIFKIEMDGEEFASDEDAMASINVEYRTLLFERDWKILNKSQTAPLGTTIDLSLILDLDNVLRVWAVDTSGEKTELTKTSFEDRFNEEKDYYVDYATNKIVFINSIPTNYASYIVDYKYAPADITTTTSPVFPPAAHGLLAYLLAQTYLRADQTQDFYNEFGNKYENIKANLVLWNEQL